MNILIICGETSANQYGAHLAQALNALGHKAYSFGDSHLALHTIQLLPINPVEHSVNIGSWGLKRHRLKTMALVLKESKISFDRAVIIDFPGYNFKIANLLQSFNISISTFITPNFWLWNQQRLGKKLLAYSDHVITIFEQEFKFFSRINSNKSFYFGHPLLLEPSKPNTSPQNRTTIGLFPGSRKSEIKDHLPVMLNIIDRLPADYTVKIVCNNNHLLPYIEQCLHPQQKRTIDIIYELSGPMDYALTAPGTNTLRLALIDVPMTIIGQLPFWIYAFAKLFMRINIKYIGLPNVIMNQLVCPEYVRPPKKEYKNIGHQIVQFLEDKHARSIFTEHMHSLRKQLAVAPSFYNSIANLIAPNKKTEI